MSLLLKSLYANTTINRNHRIVTEDVVEENAEEYDPHATYYDGGEEYPLKTESNCNPTDETTLVLAPPTKYHTMAVVPGQCVRGCLDVSSFIICLVLVILQLGLLDYYYVTVLSDKVWYSWIGADALVIVVLLWMLVLAVKYNQTQMEEVCSVDGKVKFAWIGWLVYSLVLIGKLSTCFRLFYTELPPGPLDNNDKLFDDHLFKLGLSLSVLIFLFMLEAHHYTPLMSARQLYITYLNTSICLDLVDNIYFLDLLWQSFKDGWDLAFWLDITILTLACINFVMPTFALAKLRFGRYPRLLYVSDKIWSLIYVLIVNGPFLGIRIYLYMLLEIQRNGKYYDLSLFAVKNIAMIYLAVRDVWTRLQYWRMKRANGLRGGESTAQQSTNALH
ncbi:hypothetical protein DICVIV_04853 [Dictyocaulus viviparus]|uniref:Uncharacterized protein n=1 Tax=Dictyocaulus viviparus TaxID=29172 RepID=A0A0D8XWX6_DICVI|nr:hypothetical protein DICVIV_04853 [Dictyocaulus viviparus]